MSTTDRNKPRTPIDELPTPQLVDVNTAANLLGVCDLTIRRWINDGHLRGYRLPGRGLLRIRVDDLNRVVTQVTPGEVGV